MTGRIGIDFGTSNTTVALHDSVTGQAEAVILDGVSLMQQGRGMPAASIPSLVSFEDGRPRWFGSEVIERNLLEDARTFKHMKKYLVRFKDIERPMPDGSRVSARAAAEAYVLRVLELAASSFGGVDEEVAFTLPVESFEFYDDWIRQVARKAGITRVRTLDEASAAALGNGIKIQAGDVFLVFDFGGGTLDTSLVKIEDEDSGSSQGAKCRVLGKGGVDLGGTTIDTWLMEEFLRVNSRSSADPAIRRMSHELLARCERAKEDLTTSDSASIETQDPHTGKVYRAEITRGRFEDLLLERGLFKGIENALRTADRNASRQDFGIDDAKKVILVGGSSVIPSVQQHIERRFGAERVERVDPILTVAKGAASFASGIDFYDHIQHEYAIGHINPETNKRELVTIVRAGEPYPMDDPFIRTVTPVRNGETRLRLDIFEISANGKAPVDWETEIQFDQDGCLRLVKPTLAVVQDRASFHMNKGAETFLVADPPAELGRPRFEVQFTVDNSKRLLVTADDLDREVRVLDRVPVVELT